MQGSLVGNPVQGSPLVRISELHLNSENSEKAKMCPWILSGQGWSSSSLSYIYTYIFILGILRILRRPSCVIVFFRSMLIIYIMYLNSEKSEKARMRPWVLSGQGWSSSSLTCILILMIISRSICHMCPLVLSGQGWFFSSMWNRILVV